MIDLDIINCTLKRKGPLSCPHCRAGEDGNSVGLFWDLNEKAWRCISCGHRSYERKQRTQAQLLEELVWDQVLESMDPLEKKEEMEEELESLNAV